MYVKNSNTSLYITRIKLKQIYVNNSNTSLYIARINFKKIVCEQQQH
jgi:hypothetical protein